MDPLAHTLVGAALAETGLRRATPMATATLLIGANLPDLDAAVSFAGEDAALLHRRGITHGAIAWVVLPWLLAGAMLLYDRLRRRQNPERPAPRVGVLVALAYLGVLSHSLLDWLNTYGVRFLYPFSDQWFSGNTLFIIDPWMWLLAGGAVVLARSRTWRSSGAWAVLGIVTTLLVLMSGIVPLWARMLWCAGVAAIALARIFGGAELRTVPIARASLAVLALYVALMFAGSAVAERQTRAFFVRHGVEVQEVFVSPLPATPFERDVVIVTPEHYLFGTLDWFAYDLLDQRSETMRRLNADDPVVRAALEAPSVRGFRTWMRYPSAEVEELDDGYRVTLYDVRYSRRWQKNRGIGLAVVELDRALQPR